MCPPYHLRKYIRTEERGWLLQAKNQKEIDALFPYNLSLVGYYHNKLKLMRALNKNESRLPS
jgi:hypothetical protein